mmetsp:Transcript_22386/g.40330  ORF Transcript_22386/g.40330 Transcript_22386/m.40330 type:complete len:274 (-) Transcript_22386:86-907(-)|eukprot:CAMPEP_0197661866 /NCGR_PEP_ID=MMETSP1338-20131121/51718_1 /TAXON_ID=43686 ORGANISM="Pelagodinium beii, Strain RCC1491" /NCGR_SAMPLE_ID=MMETSP1338 /ASSEMBLY_ACC=CAM_ASM_000754 /LENGTH=273 /DNA_ID=CAMNT_0043239509 /DNA_START=79 /DNA_END=900 /DNA_ORIENTATION=+
MQDPVAYFAQHMQKQQRAEQFTEDIRKVIHAGQGTSSGSRTSSPGLKAGAALALGGYGSGNSGQALSQAHAEARAAARQVAERSRNASCPFDDHRAFGANPLEDMAPKPRHTPPLAPEARFAQQEANSMGRQNRDLAQKFGAGAPFDAPERGAVPSYGSGAGAYQQAAVAAAPVASVAYNEAAAEATRFRKRMQQGSQDLISGNYLLGDSSAANKRNQSLPPAGKMLLPEAQMKLQYDGGSVRQLTHQRAEYLNARVLAESNRDRNQAAIQLR